MMEISLFEILKMAGSICAAGFGVYSAIKQDLIKHTIKIQSLEDEIERLDKRDDSAHARIDSILRG